MLDAPASSHTFSSLILRNELPTFVIRQDRVVRCSGCVRHGGFRQGGGDRFCDGLARY